MAWVEFVPFIPMVAAAIEKLFNKDTNDGASGKFTDYQVFN
jgi:hypothetical protein